MQVIVSTLVSRLLKFVATYNDAGLIERYVLFI